MKRFLVPLAAVTLFAGGCASGGGGKPTVSVTASAAASDNWSQPAWSPSPVAASVSLDVSGCAAARTLNAASALGDFATIGVILSRAQDGALAEAGTRLVIEALKASASRTAVYSRYLDVLAECLRVSP